MISALDVARRRALGRHFDVSLATVDLSLLRAATLLAVAVADADVGMISTPEGMQHAAGT